MKINIINGASKRALDKAFQLVSVYIKQIFFHSAYLIWRRRSCILFTSTTQCYVKWEKNGRELKCFVVFLTSSLETRLKCCLTLKKRAFFVESFSTPCAALERLAAAALMRHSTLKNLINSHFPHITAYTTTSTVCIRTSLFLVGFHSSH